MALAQKPSLLFLQTRPLHRLYELRLRRTQLSCVKFAFRITIRNRPTVETDKPCVDIEIPSSFPVADCLEFLTRFPGFTTANEFRLATLCLPATTLNRYQNKVLLRNLQGRSTERSSCNCASTSSFLSCSWRAHEHGKIGIHLLPYSALRSFLVQKCKR